MRLRSIIRSHASTVIWAPGGWTPTMTAEPLGRTDSNAMRTKLGNPMTSKA